MLETTTKPSKQIDQVMLVVEVSKTNAIPVPKDVIYWFVTRDIDQQRNLMLKIWSSSGNGFSI